MVNLCFQGFWVPKAGSRPEEYEDAWGGDEAAGCVAIADGASDGFESRLWARALVRAFVQQPPAADQCSVQSWLETPMTDWHSGINWDGLPWYGVEKARRGAFATLLGVAFEMRAPQEGSFSLGWSAIALGDACLFQIREGTLVEHFPVALAADFGTSPPLLSTRRAYNSRVLESLCVAKGCFGPQDQMLLATDALAAWFLARVEDGYRPWEDLDGLDAFSEFIDAQRQENAMRNDDVTLVVIQALDGSSPSE